MYLGSASKDIVATLSGSGGSQEPDGGSEGREDVWSRLKGFILPLATLGSGIAIVVYVGQASLGNVGQVSLGSAHPSIVCSSFHCVPLCPPTGDQKGNRQG